MEEKAGEKVRISFVQIDEHGKVLWDMPSTWHGFTNKQANDFVLGAIRMLADYAEKLSEDKNS